MPSQQNSQPLSFNRCALNASLSVISFISFFVFAAFVIIECSFPYFMNEVFGLLGRTVYFVQSFGSGQYYFGISVYYVFAGIPLPCRARDFLGISLEQHPVYPCIQYGGRPSFFHSNRSPTKHFSVCLWDHRCRKNPREQGNLPI